MHRDRMWVWVAHQHRWKRSQHRRWQDERGNESWGRYWDETRACADCARVFSWNRQLDCPRHAEMYRRLRSSERYHLETFGRGTPPKWWRRNMNRKYRRAMRALVVSGQDEDCYAQPREGAYYW